MGKGRYVPAIPEHDELLRKIEKLQDENFKLRQKLREARRQIPPDHAIILTDPVDTHAWNNRRVVVER